MQFTSERYKRAIKDNTRHFKVMAELLVSGIDYVDNDEILIESTDKAEITNEKSLVDRISVRYNYASLENNYTQLDGSFILPNKNFTNKYTGFISNKNIGLLKIYNNNSIPIKYINNDSQKITINFADGYPINYQIICKCELMDFYSYVNITFESTNNNNDAVVIEIPKNYNDGTNDYEISSLNEITININEWSNSYNFKIGEIFFDEVLTFSDKDIVSMDILEQTDFTNTDIPSNDYSIKLNNYERKFNITKENNVLNRLTKKSLMRTYIGLYIDGAPEYVFMGEYRYSNYKEGKDKILELNFEGQLSVFDTLEQYILANRTSDYCTLIEASTLIIGDIDPVEVLYSDDIPIKYTNFSTLREQAQALAIFYSANIRQGRTFNLSSGIIIGGMELTDLMLYNIDDTIVKTISLNEQLTYPIFTRYAKTKTIVATHNSFRGLKSDKSELFNEKVDFNITGNQYYCTIKLNLSTPIDKNTIDVYVNNTAIVTNGSDVSSTYDTLIYSTYYTITINIYISESAMTDDFKTIRVEAKEYNTEDITQTIENKKISNGAIIEYNNNFLRTTYDKNRVASFIFNKEMDYEFETEIMSDPSLEVGDTILLESVDGLHKATISTIDTKYNGGLTSVIKGVCSNVL